MHKPKLTVLGAGPGDIELITLKGIRTLEAADVVLYDALVNRELLDYATQAKLIFVGKRKGFHRYSQDEINELIVKNGKVSSQIPMKMYYLASESGFDQIQLSHFSPAVLAHSKAVLSGFWTISGSRSVHLRLPLMPLDLSHLCESNAGRTSPNEAPGPKL